MRERLARHRQLRQQKIKLTMIKRVKKYWLPKKFLRTF